MFASEEQSWHEGVSGDFDFQYEDFLVLFDIFNLDFENICSFKIYFKKSICIYVCICI